MILGFTDDFTKNLEQKFLSDFPLTFNLPHQHEED